MRNTTEKQNACDNPHCPIKKPHCHIVKRNTRYITVAIVPDDKSMPDKKPN